MSLYNHPTLKSRRRQLRHNQTDAERLLWSKLRHRQILNVKFFRQYSVGPFILDFYAPALRLAIEVDGGQHAELAQTTHDRRRAIYLDRLQIHVIRFWNTDILKNIEGVMEQIMGIFANPSQPPLAPRGGERPVPPLETRGGEGGLAKGRESV